MIVLLLCPAWPAARVQATGPEVAVGAAIGGTTATLAPPSAEPAAAAVPLTTGPNADLAASSILCGPPSPPPPPRLALSVRVTPGEAAAGETVTVTVRLANAGGPATGVVLSGVLPGGLEGAGGAHFYGKKPESGPASLGLALAPGVNGHISAARDIGPTRPAFSWESPPRTVIGRC